MYFGRGRIQKEGDTGAMAHQNTRAFSPTGRQESTNCAQLTVRVVIN